MSTQVIKNIPKSIICYINGKTWSRNQTRKCVKHD